MICVNWPNTYISGSSKPLRSSSALLDKSMKLGAWLVFITVVNLH